MTMVSSDEDLELFLGEFLVLLEKYRYLITPFYLRKIHPEVIYFSTFESQGFDKPLEMVVKVLREGSDEV